MRGQHSHYLMGAGCAMAGILSIMVVLEAEHPAVRIVAVVAAYVTGRMQELDWWGIFGDKEAP